MNTVEKRIQSREEILKNRWLIFSVLVSMPFMSCIDGSIVNVALPTIREELEVTMSVSEWVISSYLIVISALILFFGRLGDIKSKSRVFLKGILAFVLGSLLCSLSNNIYALVISRVVQAVGAAMVMSVNQGIITDVFPANERGKALGINGAFVALGSILGPALGGLIITYLSWHYIFIINLPIGTIAYLLGRRILPIHNVNENREKIDVKGAVLFILSIFLFFLPLLLSQNVGFKNPFIILSFMLSIIFLILFIIVEKRVEYPMLQLNLFKRRSFTINLICAFIIFIATNTINVIQPFYFSDVLNYNASKISLVMLASPIVLLFAAPISGSLSDKIGSKKLTLAGLFGVCIVLFNMSLLKEDSSMMHIVILLALMGLCSGVFNSPNTNIIMSSVPKDKLGIAGGTNALVRNLGFSIGASLSTTILYGKMSSVAGYRVYESVPGQEYIFVSGMKTVYLSIFVLSISALILSIIDKVKK